MKIVLLCTAAALLAACSTSSTSPSATAGKSMEEREYRTGSRIPVRDPAANSASPVTSASPSVLSPGAPKAN
mgnify:CR=1 FL=1